MLLGMLFPPMLNARRKHKKIQAKTNAPYTNINTQKTQSPEELINQLLRPVSFTPDGLKEFMRQYNSTFYIERFLPACFIHIIDFLEFGQTHEKNAQYFLSVLALFTQRLQACEWVNPYALVALLERMNEVLTTYCMQIEEKDTTSLIEAELKKAFLEKFELLKNEPDAFVAHVAQNIVQVASFGNTQFVIREIQSAVTQFLLSATSKLIWHPREKIDSWRMVVAIANQYQAFFESHLISSYEDLNTLIWSLIYRYGFFIECAGSQLSPEVYKNIQAELQEKKHSFLLLREQESDITSKESYLMNVLMRGITKSEAYTSGLNVDRYI